ncbi:monocarboxylate transporter 4 [Fusarium tjaetaba]|uniref:Monocarboxylate transporter 4 n=1 Tax=Fusarium tjaetaba TaxID=1567544 RepID=A0A8H5VY14_9HYPO|nr:monocarboxylate transporter 4 [Fusarium tjaetaba]KAF5638403.1 monocarboxylate transporter 4 [Fusarium tjaetaba]
MADPTSDLFIDFGDFQNAAEPETISPGILQTSTAPPKIGNRFSSESVKILRNWFAAHERHPYPTIQDVQDLQEQTSLNRQQVTNWFANARRRAKVHSSRPTSPMFRNDDSGNSSGHHTPIDTPRRRATPAPFEHMNPLQRWANSPPEHEAATVDDISRAVAAFSTRQGRSRKTFKTKYDWQRHEKSLHLSLENWVCSPNGPTAIHPEEGLLCVFCGVKNPDKTHLDGHNQSACIERPIEERTYHRKDHLQQHLRLVHMSKFLKWPMDDWKVMTQEVKSRCGFCGINLTTWASRVDHLADHFKAGSTMEHWKGDWGFEGKVIERIDNAMPPYLIHYERNSPLPFAATRGPADTPTSAYELIKLELEYYMRNRHQFIMPPDPELHFEACSVILGAEISSPNQASLSPSWLWDLFMSATDIATQAKLRPTKQLAEGRLSQLKINGKGNIFENCELEAALQQYMTAHTSMGHFPTDSELQQEACNVLNRTETASSHPSRRFLDFLMRLVWSSTVWLEPFRQRAETLVAMANESVNDSYFLWGQTDTAVSLDASMELDMLQPWVENRSLSPEGVPEIPAISMHSTPESRALIRDKVRTQTPFFINDNNSYRRLKRELSRFVMTTMSPNNPNRHIPSDDELKYQARWILYDE